MRGFGNDRARSDRGPNRFFRRDDAASTRERGPGDGQDADGRPPETRPQESARAKEPRSRPGGLDPAGERNSRAAAAGHTWSTDIQSWAAQREAVLSSARPESARAGARGEDSGGDEAGRDGTLRLRASQRVPQERPLGRTYDPRKEARGHDGHGQNGVHEGLGHDGPGHDGHGHDGHGHDGHGTDGHGHDGPAGAFAPDGEDASMDKPHTRFAHVSRPVGEALTEALSRHDNETFAARARLAAFQSAAPRRRLWDDEDETGDEDGAGRETDAERSRVRPDEGGLWGRDPRGPEPEDEDIAAAPDYLDDTGPTGGGFGEQPAAWEAPRAAPFPPRTASLPEPDGAGRAEDDGIARVPGMDGPGAQDDIAYARAQIARLSVGALDDDPASGQAESGSRAKTRVLGFHARETASPDPFAQDDSAAAASGPCPGLFPVGWLVIVAGAGRGTAFALFDGVSSIGRSFEHAICLDYGDTAISRSAHASVAYDNEANRFFLGAGTRSNLVRRNNRPVLATEELSSGDLVRIGETTLRFVAFCGEEFVWSDDDDAHAPDAS